MPAAIISSCVLLISYMTHEEHIWTYMLDDSIMIPTPNLDVFCQVSSCPDVVLESGSSPSCDLPLLLPRMQKRV